MVKFTCPDQQGVLRTPARRELATFGAIYVLYDTLRWLVHSRLEVARRHAHSVFALEQHVHIAVEAQVQHALGFGVPGSCSPTSTSSPSWSCSRPP